MRRLGVAVALLVALVAAGCGGGGSNPPKPKPAAEVAAAKVAEHRKVQAAYVPKNDVELRNYNDAQKIYDDPASILWCTFSFNNPSSPLVTVPVAGKLTSSSTSYFRPEETAGGYADGAVLTRQSVDGLYHKSPAPYRYGFTPGGAYVDFFNLETYCSNKPTEFQRQQTKISLRVDSNLGAADQAAQKALKSGNKAEAQRIIENAIGGSK